MQRTDTKLSTHLANLQRLVVESNVLITPHMTLFFSLSLSLSHVLTLFFIGKLDTHRVRPEPHDLTLHLAIKGGSTV
jgi:hypothetical protein